MSSLPEDPGQQGAPQNGEPAPDGIPPALPHDPTHVIPPQPGPIPPGLHDPNQSGPPQPGYPPRPGLYDPNQPYYYPDPNQRPYYDDPAVGPNPLGLVDEHGYPLGYTPPEPKKMSGGIKALLIGCGTASALGLIGVFAFVIVILGPCIGLKTF